MYLKIIRFSITSLSLLIREAFTTIHSLNVAELYHRILENILNITMTADGPGALTRTASPLRIIYQSCEENNPAVSLYKEMWGLVLILFHLIKKQLKKILSCIFNTWFQLVQQSRTLNLIKALTCTFGAWTMYSFILQGGWSAVLNIFFKMLTKTQGCKLRKKVKRSEHSFVWIACHRLLEPCMQRRLIWWNLQWALTSLYAESIMLHETCAQRLLDGRSITSGNTTYGTVNFLHVTNLLKR